MFARNSVLARLTLSDSSLAATRASSIALRAEMSTDTVSTAVAPPGSFSATFLVRKVSRSPDAVVMVSS